MKAMLLAAGLGTRLKPFTDKHPKALAVINGKTLLQRNIEYLQRFGIKDVIINVHHFAEQIVEEIKKNNGWNSNINISDESDAVLETGGGLKRAAWFFENESNFILMNVDVLTDLNLKEIISFHEKEKPLSTLAVTDRKSSRFFLFDENSDLCGWENVKTGDKKICVENKSLIQKAFSGIHIINTKMFSLMKNEGKFSVVDVYLDLIKANIIKGFDHSQSKFIDVGKPENILKAEEMFI